MTTRDKQQRRQDHFNKAYLGVIAQGGPSYDRNVQDGVGSCLYLAPNGNKCAVGHILTKKELEDFGDFIGGVGELANRMGLGPDHPFKSDEDFYAGIQNIHDRLDVDVEGSEFIPYFKRHMMAFALEYNLQLPKVGDETATA